MSAVESRLAAIAVDHAPDQLSPDDGYSWVDGCTCGWMGTESPNWDAQEWADMDAPEYRTYRLWAEHLAQVIASSDDLAVIAKPDAKNPTPALIEAAYIAQDDLSKPPAPWLIEATAEIIDAYIDAQGHDTVHVIGHDAAVRAARAAGGVSDR